MTSPVPADHVVLDLLRGRKEMTIADLAEELGVTATAVRQRVMRLMESGLVSRQSLGEGRGRPSHRYSLTAKGRRDVGSNFGDLAEILWDELRAVSDPETKRGMLRRVAVKMAGLYAGRMSGRSVKNKMRSIADTLSERNVPFSVDEDGELPVLTAKACPYPDLAERDHSVCAMERMMFSELLGEKLRLTQCRLDGSPCCTFELS